MTMRPDTHRWARLSAHADDALPPAQREEVEQLLREDAEARAEFERIRALKEALRARSYSEAAPSLWPRIADAIDHDAREAAEWSPVPSRLRPVAVALAVLVVAAAGALAVIKRDSLIDYLSRRSSDMQLAYEENLKGWLMPLLERTDNDKVLQFAVFGTLSLDEHAHSVVRIDSAEQYGYRIAFGAGTHTTTRVSVEELYRAVEATPTQRRRIDTVFAEAQRHLESAVLVSDDNTIAIDQRLAGLDNVILSSVAAALEPAQRTRMARYLDTRGRHYEISSVVPVVEPVAALTPIQQHMHTEQSSFVVVSGGQQAMVRRVRINTDSIRRVIERVVVPEAAAAERRAATERMNIELKRMQRDFERIQRLDGDRDVSVTREDDVIIIQVAPSILGPEPPPPPQVRADGTAPPRPPAPRVTLPGFPRSTITVRVGPDSTTGLREDRLRVRMRGEQIPGFDIDVDSVVQNTLRSVPQLRQLQRLGVPRTADSLHIFLRRFGVPDSVVRMQLEQSPRIRVEVDRVLREMHEEMERELDREKKEKNELQRELQREGIELQLRRETQETQSVRKRSDTTHSI
jgi:hypothetical protein